MDLRNGNGEPGTLGERQFSYAYLLKHAADESSFVYDGGTIESRMDIHVRRMARISDMNVQATGIAAMDPSSNKSVIWSRARQKSAARLSALIFASFATHQRIYIPRSHNCDSATLGRKGAEKLGSKLCSHAIYPVRVSQQSLGSPHRGAPQVVGRSRSGPQRGSTWACVRTACTNNARVMEPRWGSGRFWHVDLGCAVITATPGFDVRPRWGQSQCCRLWK